MLKCCCVKVYKIMGKNADLTAVHQMSTSSLQKGKKSQKVFAKEAGCLQSAPTKHINIKFSGRQNCVRKSNRGSSIEKTMEQRVFRTFTMHGVQMESIL